MKNNPGIAGWIESLAITILFLIVSLLLNDPLSLSSHFPWIWFAPVLIALRYGIWPSLCSIIVLIGSSLYKDIAQLETIHYQLYVLGGFLLTVVCGIFQKRWATKIAYNETISNYLQKRIQNTADAYKTVLQAFQHLEHSFITKPVTIRSTLDDIRQLLAHSNEPFPKDIYNQFLNLLVHHCNCEIAAIFPVNNGCVQREPVVSVGKVASATQGDYLIAKAIEYKAMTYVTIKEVLKGHLSDYLIVAPMLDQEDIIYALVVIQDIPFLKLNEENLETLNILIQYFTEGKTVKHADRILKNFPECSVDFANELQRLSNLQKKTKLDSALIALTFYKGPQQEEYIFRLEQEKRGIDTLWETSEGQLKILFVLMPMSSLTGIESYKARIRELLSREFNINLDAEEIRFKARLLSSNNNPVDLIKDLMNKK